jgi:hypothetical protein
MICAIITILVSVSRRSTIHLNQQFIGSLVADVLTDRKNNDSGQLPNPRHRAEQSHFMHRKRLTMHGTKGDQRVGIGGARSSGSVTNRTNNDADFSITQTLVRHSSHLCCCRAKISIRRHPSYDVAANCSTNAYD